MIKSIKAILAQDKEKFKVPRKVQDLIPIKNIWPDGIFKVGNKFSKSFRFSDINYLVASREDKESMFLTYSELLNSLDSGAATKITINNHRLNRSDFEESILMPMKQDGLDEYHKRHYAGKVYYHHRGQEGHRGSTGIFCENRSGFDRPFRKPGFQVCAPERR